MRIRLPERLSLVDLILWGLRVAIIVFVTVATYVTLTEGTLKGADWRNLIVYGIAQGSVYALIALGYTLVYGVLFMINFAHGDVFMAGAMTAFFVADYFGDTRKAKFCVRQSALEPELACAQALVPQTTPCACVVSDAGSGLAPA